jgi:hypothetical protein
MVVGREFSHIFPSTPRNGGGGRGSRVDAHVSNMRSSLPSSIGSGETLFIMMIPKTSPIMPCESECDDWSIERDLTKLSLPCK